jgi:hypothetical protein
MKDLNADGMVGSYHYAGHLTLTKKAKMDDNDFIKVWVMGLLFIIGLVILAMMFFYNANDIVDAAYRGSDYVLEYMR